MGWGRGATLLMTFKRGALVEMREVKKRRYRTSLTTSDYVLVIRNYHQSGLHLKELPYLVERAAQR